MTDAVCAVDLFTIANEPGEPSAVRPKPRPLSIRADWLKLRNTLKAALVVCSEDDSRLALNSVLVQVREDYIRFVATDGHRLLRIDMTLPLSRPEFAGEFECLLRRDDVVAFCKLAPPRGKYAIPLTVELAAAGSGATISGSFGVANIGGRDPDLQFPPYEQCIPESRQDSRCAKNKTNRLRPDEPAPICMGVSAKYLGHAGTIAGLLYSDKAKDGVRIEFGANDLEPIRCEFDYPGEFAALYLIMPMRM